MKRLAKTLLCLFITSVIVTVGLVSTVFFKHYMILDQLNILHVPISNVISHFLRHGENPFPYAESVKKEELDLKALSKEVFSDAIGASSSTAASRTYWLSSPITIRYYSDPNAIFPVFTVDKGDIICCSNELLKSTVTYHGLESLPSLKYGWRLAKPFIVEGEEPNDALLYVKTSDLVKIFRAWNKEITHPSNIREKIWSYYIYPQRNLLYIDRMLYKMGIFVSPDLVAFVCPPAPFISLSVSVILLTAYLVVRRKIKKLNK